MKNNTPKTKQASIPKLSFDNEATWRATNWKRWPEWLWVAPFDMVTKGLWWRLWDMHRATGKVFFKHSTLATELGVSVPAIRRRLRILSKAGLVVRKRQVGGPNLYVLPLDHEQYRKLKRGDPDHQDHPPDPGDHTPLITRITPPDPGDHNKTGTTRTGETENGSPTSATTEEGPILSPEFSDKSGQTVVVTKDKKPSAVVTEALSSAPDPLPEGQSQPINEAEALLALCPEGSTDLDELAELVKVRGDDARLVLGYLQGKDWSDVMTGIKATVVAKAGFNVQALTHPRTDWVWKQLLPEARDWKKTAEADEAAARHEYANGYDRFCDYYGEKNVAMWLAKWGITVQQAKAAQDLKRKEKVEYMTKEQIEAEAKKLAEAHAKALEKVAGKPFTTKAETAEYLGTKSDPYVEMLTEQGATPEMIASLVDGWAGMAELLQADKLVARPELSILVELQAENAKAVAEGYQHDPNEYVIKKSA